MNILVTNDDGIESGSLPVLLKTLKKTGKFNILTVVPDREQSGSSHSITLTRPLRLTKVRKNVYTLDGTPTDCVNVVLLKGLSFKKIDLVISGINRGPNLSEDVFYSGTVAAAREAALFNLPAIAVSLVTDKKNPDYSFAALFITRLLTIKKWQKKELLNINIPDIDKRKIKGVHITFLGNRKYKDVLVKRKDPWGNPYFWLQGKSVVYSRQPDSDCFEVSRGFISITPLSLNLTDKVNFENMKKLLEEKKWQKILY